MCYDGKKKRKENAHDERSRSSDSGAARGVGERGRGTLARGGGVSGDAVSHRDGAAVHLLPENRAERAAEPRIAHRPAREEQDALVEQCLSGFPARTGNWVCRPPEGAGGYPRRELCVPADVAVRGAARAGNRGEKHVAHPRFWVLSRFEGGGNHESADADNPGRNGAAQPEHPEAAGAAGKREHQHCQHDAAAP